MSFVSANVIKFDDRMFKTLKVDNNKPWLVSFCREIDEGDCLDDDQVYKLAVMLVREILLLIKNNFVFFYYQNNLVQVGSVNCHADPYVCHRLQPQSAILFYKAGNFPLNDSYSITSLNLKEIASQILALLPNLPVVTEDHLNVRRIQMK